MKIQSLSSHPRDGVRSGEGKGVAVISQTIVVNDDQDSNVKNTHNKNHKMPQYSSSQIIQVS